jgi:uncharacterized protein (DUF924 family)
MRKEYDFTAAKKNPIGVRSMKKPSLLDRLRAKKAAEPDVVIGVVWYTEYEWALVKAFAEDPEPFENSYAEWLKMAEESFELVKQKIPGAMKVYVSAAELSSWCAVHGVGNSSESRTEFVLEKVGIIRGEGASPAMNDIDSILEFWLEPKPTTLPESEAAWQKWFFQSSPELDRIITERFGQLLQRARNHELDSWKSSPRGTLALIILIDQFSRNVYRGKAEAFAADALGLELAREGYATGTFDYFDLTEHLFAAMPFRHAEDLVAQRSAVDLAQHHAVLAATTQPALLKAYVESVEWARRHYDVIARFGRFPHRNATLGRDTTPEEAEYLAYLKTVGQWL